jgi:hypothetical protein
MRTIQITVCVLMALNFLANAADEEVSKKIQAYAEAASPQGLAHAKPQQYKTLEWRKLSLTEFASEILASSDDTKAFKLLPNADADAIKLDLHELPILEPITVLQAVCCLNGYVVRVDRERKEIALEKIEDAWGKKPAIEETFFITCGRICNASVYHYKAEYMLASTLAFPDQGIRRLSTESYGWLALQSQNILVLSPAGTKATYSLVKHLMSNDIEQSRAAVRFSFLISDPNHCGAWLDGTLDRIPADRLSKFKKETKEALRDCLNGGVRIQPKHWPILKCYRKAFADDAELCKTLDAQIALAAAAPGSDAAVHAAMMRSAEAAAALTWPDTIFNYKELQNSEGTLDQIAHRLLKCAPNTADFSLVAKDAEKISLKLRFLPELHPILVLHALAIQHGLVVNVDVKAKTVALVPIETAWSGTGDQARALALQYASEKYKDKDEKENEQSGKKEYVYAVLLTWDEGVSKLENHPLSRTEPAALRLGLLAPKQFDPSNQWPLFMIGANDTVLAAALHLIYANPDQKPAAAALEKTLEIDPVEDHRHVKGLLRAAILNVFRDSAPPPGSLTDVFKEMFKEDVEIKKILINK